MADIASLWDPATGTADWQIDAPQQIVWVDQAGNSVRDQDGRSVGAAFVAGDGLLDGGDLYTAVLISLFTDAEAGSDDVLPDASSDRRGWWGGEIGSKLWLRARGKRTPTLLATVKHDVEQALAWMIDDNVVATITVETEFQPDNRLAIRIILVRRDGARAALRFSRLWENI